MPNDLKRVYRVQFGPHCLPQCPFCAGLGCTQNFARQLGDLQRAFARARSGEYSALAFSAAFFVESEEFRLEALVLAERFDLEVFLEVPYRALPQLGLALRKMLERPHPPGLTILLHPADAVSLEEVRRWRALATQIEFVLVLRNRLSPIRLLQAMDPESRKSLFFQAPPLLASDPFGLTVAAANRQIGEVRKAFPDLRVAPPPGRDVWDPRIPPDFDLEPVFAPLWESIGRPNRCDISVVIPSYNSAALLENVLLHLAQQTLAPERYEVIVVDDGSTDDTCGRVRAFGTSRSSRLNICLLRLPRRQARKMGDGAFRAGIARNFGVKHARGELLFFLDSDILIGPKHLEELIELHTKHDLVQSVRLHLKPHLDQEGTRYGSVEAGRDTFVLESSYWGQFFQASSWMGLPFHWKYCCTYALSLKKETFKALGWFRKTFIFYGFEDTDLGYRAANAGLSFFLWKVPTFHMSTAKERSEYSRSGFVRHQLLSKTAKVFYLNCLDSQVFEHFRSFMAGERSLALGGWLKFLWPWRHGRRAPELGRRPVPVVSTEPVELDLRQRRIPNDSALSKFRPGIDAGARPCGAVFVSAGRELADFVEIRNGLPEQGKDIWVFLSRPLNDLSLGHLDLLAKSHPAYRLAISCTRSQDPIAVVADLPSHLLARTHFVFLRDGRGQQEFLSLAEAYLACTKLRCLDSLGEVRILRLVSQSGEALSHWRLSDKLFRQYLRENYAGLGSFPRPLRFLAKAFVFPLFYFVHFFFDPAETVKCVLSDAAYFRRLLAVFQAAAVAACRWIFWGFYHLYCETFGQIARAWPALYWPIHGFACSLAYDLYWTVRPVLESPAFYCKQRVPVFYYLVFYPPLKTFWFLEHQWRKRVLGLIKSGEAP
jgi:glycosyltransferase involved in cell wall biosynthesis